MTRPDPCSPHAPPGLIGRAAEREALDKRLSDLLAGRSAVVILEAEAGLGKSRLLAGMRDHAETLGIAPLQGGGELLSRSTPYHAWRAVFARIFQLDARDSMPARRAAVAAALPRLIDDSDSVPDLLPLLNPVLSLDFPETPVTERMTGGSRAAHTQKLLVRVLSAIAARHPMLLVMEDAHWLDSASALLLKLAVQHVSPLYALLALRPLDGQAPADLRILLDSPGSQRLTLNNLGPEETAELVCQALEVNGLAPEVAEFISERAEGHPFLSIELAASLRDAGLLAVDDGACRLAPDAPDLRALNLPSTIDGAIIRHFERMTPSQQLSLKVASVIGRAFASRSLGAAFPSSEDPPALAESLPPLEQLDLLASETPERAYVLEQSLKQETVYRQLLLSQRQELHRAIAEWHERVYFQDLSPYYPLLAHHWLRADESERALEYLERAGDQALQEGAFQEAIRFFEDAIANGRDVPPARRARWERQLGRALLGLNHVLESRNHFHRALDLLGSPVPSHMPTLLAGLAGELLTQVLHRLRPETLTTERRKLGDPAFPSLAPAERDAHLEPVRVYEHLVELYLFTHELLPLAYAALRSLNLAERAPASPQLAWAYAHVSMLAGALKAAAWAEALEQKARAVPLGEGDLATRAGMLLRLTAYRLASGQWQRLEEIAVEALTVSEALGDRRKIAEALAVLGNGLCYRGAIARGGDMFAEILRMASLDGEPQFVCWGSSGLATMRFRQGELDGAMQLLEDARPAFEATGDGLLRIVYLGQLASGHLRRGDWAKAWKYALSAYGMAASSPITWQLEAYFGIMEVCVAFLEAEGKALPVPRRNVERLARKACRLTLKAGRMFPAARAQARYWQGRYLWQQGKTSQALSALRESVRHAQEREMPYEEALARQALAQRLPSGDPAREAHVEAASAIATRIGASLPPPAWPDKHLELG